MAKGCCGMFMSDDVVTTADGKQHRVIYQIKDHVMVRTLNCKHKKPIKVCVTKIVRHEPKVKK